MKRLISALLVLLMLVSLVPTTVFADDTVNQSTVNDDTNATIAEDGGLGGLIANSLEEQETTETEEDVNIENKILDVKVEGNIATVAFNNAVECNIIVAIYDETTNAMVGSGMGSFAEHTELAEIEIDVDKMPEYFVVKAYLLDAKNNPLHTSYESIEYTEEYQYNYAKTIEDFEGEQILNLDESDDNNFAVFQDGVIDLTSETLTSADDTNYAYVFENSDIITSLEVGEIFFYKLSEEEYIIGRIEKITVSDTCSTIVSEEGLGLDDIFSYVKIEAESNGSDAVADLSSADEGVYYQGTDGPATYGLIGKVDKDEEITHTYPFDEVDLGKNVKLTGGLSFGVNVGIKAFLYCTWEDWFYSEVEFTVTQNATFSLSLTGEIDLVNVSLGVLTVPLPGCTAGIDVVLKVSVSGEISFTATEDAVIGFKYSSLTGQVTDLSRPPECNTELNLEVVIYVGLALEPNVSTLKGRIRLCLSAELGAEITVTNNKPENSVDKKHACIGCLDGDIDGKFKLTLNLYIGNGKTDKKEKVYVDKTFTIIPTKTFDIMGFYWSPDLGFGIGDCPNDSYRITYRIIDINKKPIVGATVGDAITDSNGVASVFKNGKFETLISKSGYKSYTHWGNKASVNEFVITLYKPGECEITSWNASESGNVIYKGNNEGSTKVYFYDSNAWGSSANVYAYTYKYLPAAGVDEELGTWPGVPCDYEGANIWSIDMPKACTHILFSYNGDTSIEGQTNDIPNPGKTMIAIRTSGYEYNDVGGYHPVYKWEEYNVSTASINMMAELDELAVTDSVIVATNDEATADEPDVQITIKEKISVGDLVPGGMYAFMMLKGSIGNYTVNTDSLVYITDGIADESGNIEFTYYYEPFSGEWLGVVFGPCNHKPGDWKVINEPTLDSEGFKAKFCTKCAEVLDTEVIPEKKIEGIYLVDTPALITGNEESIDDIYLYVLLDDGDGFYIYGTDCTIEGYDCNNAGQQSVAVTYKGFTDYITVDVFDRNEIYEDVYFINIQNWDSVYVYYYGSAYESVEYPGVKMSYVETNSLGQDIYTASIPKDVTLIKFNDSSENIKTVNIDISENLDGSMGWYTTNLGSVGSWNVSEFIYYPEADNIPATYDEIVGTKTIYFTNSTGWNYVYIYCWNDAGESVAWPGTAMTYVRTNAYSQKIYKAEIPDDITNIIFNNNGYYQTIDITEGVEDGIGFYTAGYLGSYIYDVERYVYDEHSDDIETEPVEEGKVESNVLIKGTFNDWKGSMMYYTDDTSTVVSTMILEPGTYEFKVYKTDSATWLGNTGIIEDTTETTSSSGWTMKAAVSANCTLVATGGTYTFYFDTSTNKLIIKHSVVVETEPTEPTETTIEVTTDATEPSEETTKTPELPSVEPAFSGASLTLHDNISINFKANESLFTEVGYENPYVVYELNGEEFIVSDYEIVGGKYVFDFADIAPNNMNDTVKATLYATFDGVEYVSETREYSVATYCYNMLNKYTTAEYAELQTLLVDLLNYGAMSQIYTSYKTDDLVNANLTDTQKAWGTVDTPTYETVQNVAYKTIDNPTVQWKGGGLNLVDAVTMRFKISADSGSYENLVVKAETDDRIWTIPYETFTETTGGYYVYFSGLNSGEMSEPVYLTVYENGVAVSNTLSYSIESYAYSKQNSTDENLTNLLEAMMKYGNSAKAYVN